MHALFRVFFRIKSRAGVTFGSIAILLRRIAPFLAFSWGGSSTPQTLLARHPSEDRLIGVAFRKRRLFHGRLTRFCSIYVVTVDHHVESRYKEVPMLCPALSFFSRSAGKNTTSREIGRLRCRRNCSRRESLGLVGVVVMEECCPLYSGIIRHCTVE